MTNIQIKTRLKNKINKIDDIAFLMAIETILESKTNEETPFPLNEAQKQSIRISKEQFKKGLYKDHREVINNAKRWLKRK